jgi:hypothetical protein
MGKKQNKKKEMLGVDKPLQKKGTKELRDEFDRRVKKAWKSHDKGKFKSKSKKQFLDELEKC